ncbi:MAG TPA: GNAT family protein [Thermomicrobiales bacterium]|nr:GNAT family protein [Thermomicrobiales bacterium]
MVGAEACAQPVVNIVGERVALGPLRRDLVPLYQRWVNDFGTQRTLGDVPRPRTAEDLAALYECGTTDPAGAQFTIYERATRRPIGIAELQAIDHRARTATLVLFIGPPVCRGRGYGTETVRLLRDYAFAALGLRSLVLTVFAYNRAGIRAYERAGFRECGRRRQAHLLGGRLWDEIQMECLAAEVSSADRGNR